MAAVRINSRDAEFGEGAGLGNLPAHFLKERAKFLNPCEAFAGESCEEDFDLWVLGVGGVAQVETGGALFGGDDELHGFIKAGIVAGVDQSRTDADGEFIFRR